MLSSCAKDIQSYVSSGTCRREQINSYFDHPTNVPNTSQPTGHNCCDSCAALCTCNNGTCTYDPVWAAPVESTPETRSPMREVSDEQLSTLKKGLLLYKKKWIAYCMEKIIPHPIIKCLPFLAQASYWNLEISILHKSLKMPM